MCNPAGRFLVDEPLCYLSVKGVDTQYARLKIQPLDIAVTIPGGGFPELFREGAMESETGSNVRRMCSRPHSRSGNDGGARTSFISVDFGRNNTIELAILEDVLISLSKLTPSILRGE